MGSSPVVSAILSINTRAGARVLLEIRKISRRGGDPHGIENRGKIDDFLRDSSSDGRQKAERGRKHSKYAQRHSANGGLQSDPTHSLRDVNQFVHTSQ